MKTFSSTWALGLFLALAGQGSAQVPSELPSLAPSAAPSSLPTFNFTFSPVPSEIPSMTPSMAPSIVTQAPVINITVAPSSAPSFLNLTEAPSLAPSLLPSISPTLMPSNSSASAIPTATPSATPSLMPSVLPTMGIQDETVEDLSMILYGISEFPEDDFDEWARITASYQQLYYQSVPDSVITEFETTVTIKAISIPPSRRKLRNLQSDQEYVSVLYDQTMTYRATADAPGPVAVALAPFELELGRDRYVELLNDSGQGVLTDITSSSTVVADATLQPTPSPVEETDQPTEEDVSGGDDDDSDDDGGLSTNAIIGIAVGGGVALIALLLCCFFKSGGDYEGHNDPPPSVNFSKGGDEVSTLAPPAYDRTPASPESIAGYGDQSVATVDYDYSKAYGGGGDTSVSSAGGTFGSQTFGQSVLDPARAGATGAALGGVGSFSDTDSFGGGTGYRDPNANFKEQLINIFAPPGKLGVVIDTPDDGAPVVHAVKDSSVIAGQIFVGDKLVAVDDEDVRTMTAIKVSKLISRKSTNPSRKLSVIRMTPI